MPNRIIREQCRTSPTLAKLSSDAERLFWRLTTFADDYGRFEADVETVRGACFPRLLSFFTNRRVTHCLSALKDAGAIVLYRVEDREYGQFANWQKHQRIRAEKSKYPGPVVDNGAQPRTSAVKC